MQKVIQTICNAHIVSPKIMMIIIRNAVVMLYLLSIIALTVSITIRISDVSNHYMLVTAMSAPISDISSSITATKTAISQSGQPSSSSSSSLSSSVTTAATTTKTESISTFRLGIRDSIMIAHSFHNHPAFGPAGGVHGATYTCDVEFVSSSIQSELNWVIDIGEAMSILHDVLAKYNYKNLDDIFGPNIMTTTEFMCQQIHTDICQQLHLRNIIIPSSANAPQICVKLYESHKAWGSYTAPIS